MDIVDTNNRWFPEPLTRDDSWAERGESPFDWLTRSTLPRATAARAFLNRNITQLPADAQAVLHNALRSRWHSAFFELIVARTLQLLGAALTVEPVSQDGSRVDFVASFPDGTINVEAMAPLIDSEAGETIKVRNALLDIIDSLTPAGWGVGVQELPALGPSDSKRAFRAALTAMFESLPQEGKQPVEFVTELEQGFVRLLLWPKRLGHQPVLFEPPITSWNDTEARIRWAVRRKKRQARGAVGPTLVAIHAGGVSSKFEDFDIALFGHDVMVLDHDRKVAGTRFELDGVFAKPRAEPPVLAGVLAFVRVGYRAFAPPVLYLHPRFQGTLPSAFADLEQRYLERDRVGISTRSSRRSDLLSSLEFIPEDI